jgi:hypothetical protein
MEPISYTGVLCLLHQSFEGNAAWIVLDQGHFTTLKISGLGPDHALDLPELHFARPKAVLSERDALGRFIRRLRAGKNNC